MHCQQNFDYIPWFCTFLEPKRYGLAKKKQKIVIKMENYLDFGMWYIVIILMNYCPKYFGNGAFESPWHVLCTLATDEQVRAFPNTSRALPEHLWYDNNYAQKLHFGVIFPLHDEIETCRICSWNAREMLVDARNLQEM